MVILWGFCAAIAAIFMVISGIEGPGYLTFGLASMAALFLFLATERYRKPEAYK